MKFLNQLDLENLINNQIEENLYLDYKAADALQKSDSKRTELTKDVSAFANSDGGFIIYGIKEFSEITQKHLPEKIDPLDRKNISKEWIEQVINGGISPRIEGIVITPIHVTNEIDKVVYVVEIPKSNLAHQASDKKYYKRFNFESLAMFDYEIRDIMNRNKFPKIELSLTIEQQTIETNSTNSGIPLKLIGNSFLEPSQQQKLKNTLLIKAKNVGNVYANYVNCFLEIPANWLNSTQYEHIKPYYKDGILYKKLFRDNTIREVKEVKIIFNNSFNEYWPSRYDPILPGINFNMNDIILCENIQECKGKIFWELYSDNSPQILAEKSLIDIPVQSKN